MEDIEIIEYVNGLSLAVNRVKEKQNNLAIKELGHPPELRGLNEYKFKPKVNSKKEKMMKKKEEIEGKKEKFQKLLFELSKKYRIFPKYMIELLIDDYQIPKTKLNNLIMYDLKKKILEEINKNYYKYLK